jgi:membrane protein
LPYDILEQLYYNGFMTRQKSPPLRQFAVSLGGRFFRQIWLTAELFGKKGLANHAAAGAYGFFLSAAPALLIVSFFIFRVIQTSPETAAELISKTGFFSGTFDVHGIIQGFLASQKHGIPGLISVLSVFWAAVVFSSVTRRGFDTVFTPPPLIAGTSPKTRRGFFEGFCVSLGIEAALVIFTFAAVINSQLVFRLFNFLDAVPPDITRGFRIVSVMLPNPVMILLIYLSYRLVPVVPPGRAAALKGTLFCVIVSGVVSFLLRFILLPGRYNFLYGALGNIIIFIVNVYFFFMFFFFGAELSSVTGSFDVLYFSRFRKIHSAPEQKHGFFEKLLFSSPEGPLGKYRRKYKPGEVILRKNDTSGEVYYLLSGSVRVFIKQDGEDETTLIHEGNFFGEMEYLLNQPGSAEIRAEIHAEIRANDNTNANGNADSDVVALVFSPEIFGELLRNDPATQFLLMETQSERLKQANERLVAEGRSS